MDLRLVLLASLLALPASLARAEADSAPWTSASLLRGPTAMANAPLVPFRSAAGGAHVALDDPVAGVKRRIILVPALTLGGGAMGLVDAGLWLVAGLADTFTGGYFALAPEPATHFSLDPIRPAFTSH
jgi:hypothetical protein